MRKLTAKGVIPNHEEMKGHSEKPEPVEAVTFMIGNVAVAQINNILSAQTTVDDMVGQATKILQERSNSEQGGERQDKAIAIHVLSHMHHPLCRTRSTVAHLSRCPSLYHRICIICIRPNTFFFLILKIKLKGYVNFKKSTGKAFGRCLDGLLSINGSCSSSTLCKQCHRSVACYDVNQWQSAERLTS
jgi:hypothetical protein